MVQSSPCSVGVLTISTSSVPSVLHTFRWYMVVKTSYRVPKPPQDTGDSVFGNGHAHEDHGAVFMCVLLVRYGRHGYLRGRHQRPAPVQVCNILKTFVPVTQLPCLLRSLDSLRHPPQFKY